MRVFLKRGALFVLVMMAGIFPVLRSLGYQNTDTEVLLVMAALSFLGFGIASLVSRCPALERWILSIFVYWLLDSFLPGRAVSTVIGIVGGVVSVFLFNSRFAENARAALVVFCIFWLLGCYAEPARKLLHPIDLGAGKEFAEKQSASKNLRPIVHFILDEQMSPRTAPETLPEGHPAAYEIDHFVKRGFVVHSNVTASSSQTRTSISQTMAYEEKENSTRSIDSFENDIVQNKYFEHLNSKGYRISAIISTHLNLCTKHVVDDCRYYGWSTVTTLTGFEDKKIDRVVMALLALHTTFGDNKSRYHVLAYQIVKEVMKLLKIGPRYKISGFARPVQMFDVNGAIREDLKKLELGDLRFYHILLPHFPYVLSSDCNLNRFPQWAAASRYAVWPVERRFVYSAYWDQSACAHKQIFEIIDLIKSTHGRLDPIIIVHGDHGSRIDGATTSGNSREMLETYFAVYRREFADKAVEKITPTRLPKIFKQTLDESDFRYSAEK